MQVIYSGYNHTHDSDLYVDRPLGSGDYLLLLVRSPAIFTIHGKEIMTVPNIFFLYNKGTPQHYRASGSSFSNDWIHFDMSEDELRYLKKIKIPFETPIPLGDMEFISMLVSNINTEQYSANQHKESTIDAYLHILLNKVSESVFRKPAGINDQNYDKFLLLRSKIYNRPYLKWEIANLAHQICLSPYYFQHQYKKHFGITCINDVICARIEYAKHLLRTTHSPIRLIAEQCGYENDVHFMRQFKKSTGFTPSQYRKLPNEECPLPMQVNREGPDIYYEQGY